MTIAYLTTRKKSWLTEIIDTLSMFPYIIPGSVLGITLLLAFNDEPLLLSGTAAIIIISLIIRRLPYTLRSSSAILYQLSPSMEEASISLGASPQMCIRDSYKGLYCTPCESYWTEHQLDENGCCPDCHRPVQEVSEEAYFFKMSKYADRVLQYIEDHPDFIQPVSRRNEMINFIKQGLDDLCICLLYTSEPQR